MFFFRHPKPVIDGRAVAVQVVQQQRRHEVFRTLLIAEPQPASGPAPAPAVSEPDASGLSAG